MACQFGSPVSVAVVLLVTTLLLLLDPAAVPPEPAPEELVVVVSGKQNDVELMAPGEVMVGDDGALQG